MKKLLSGLLATLMLSSAAAAQTLSPPPLPAPPPPLPRTIAVSGEAHEEVAPDQAILSLSLVSKDKSLNVAKQNNDKLVEKLIDVAKQLEIPKEKISTTGINVSPEYRYINQEQQFIGYVVSRSFRVTMDKLDVSEKLLSAAVDAGVQDVSGIQYTIAKPEDHEAALRLKAYADAKAKAEALAQAAGGKLGPALDIATGGQSFSPRRPMLMEKAMALGAAKQEGMSVAPSLPGMLELSETVSVVFALE